MKKQEDRKISIGALIRKSTWREFRKFCIDVGRGPGDMLDYVMNDYMKRKKGGKEDK